MNTAIDGDSETPRGIDAMMGRLFFSMNAGRNHNLPVYVPLDVIREACRQLSRNADALIDSLLLE